VTRSSSNRKHQLIGQEYPPLDDSDVLVLSRFAYQRRRGHEMVLESPRAGALIRVSDPQIVAAITRLCTPQQIRTFRTGNAFTGLELLALLVDCEILFKTDPAREQGFRRDEGGDDYLVFWDFHDLLFHARSAEGRHPNPSGGTYPYMNIIPPLPAVRPSWPGEKINLHRLRRRAAGFARRKAPARPAFDAQLRRPATDHTCGAVAIPRRRRQGPNAMAQQA